MREVIVRVAGVESRDQVSKGSATGDLAERTKRTCSG